MVYDLTIIGSGPAGMTAAIYAARANLKVLVIEKLVPGGQVVNTFEVQNYPGFETIGGAELGIKMYEHMMALGVAFENGEVRELKKDGSLWRVVCDDDTQVYEAKSVLIATGTKPRMLHVPHELDFAGSSISWCAICDGAKYRGKDVIIIGGGNSAVEEAIYLAGLCNKVTVVTMLDLTATPSACDKLRSIENVSVYEWYDIGSFLPGETFKGLTAKNSKTGEELTVYADGAFEYIGLEPVAGVFKPLGICDRAGYIPVDGNMMTSQPGLFAAGDVTAKELRQIVTACSDGAFAAQKIAKYVGDNF